MKKCFLILFVFLLFTGCAKWGTRIGKISKAIKSSDWEVVVYSDYGNAIDTFYVHGYVWVEEKHPNIVSFVDDKGRFVRISRGIVIAKEVKKWKLKNVTEIEFMDKEVLNDLNNAR